MKNKILSALGSHPWAEALIWHNSIDSTNDEAKRLAAAGAPHGTVILAGHQSKGRGRIGRTFHSPEGKGVYCSVILRPQCKPEDLMHLTCAVGVAMCDAVEAVCGVRPGIKWINDLVLGNRKLGGILTELALDADGSVRYAVVGVGINCSHTQYDFPEELREIATSLEMATEKTADQAQLSAEIIKAFTETDKHLLRGKYGIMDRYRADCITIGKDIVVHTSQESFRGTALDVDPDGALVVRSDNGRIQAVQSGEVSVRGLYGYCQ
ncbi:MAG: biotin--[Oscillospiraceae bacterium]|nr:biotin--[acetyl-CoA-carboxylase] ligase [Oscillospiraceae bacterium]